MRPFKIFLFLIISFNNFLVCAANTASETKQPDSTLSQGLDYKKTTTENHVIHILTIDPKLYHLELVKAHNGVFGRETVPEIALRKNAVAAVNAGFFEIGNSEDGRPSGNLIINGMILGLAKEPRSSLILDHDKLDIARIRGNIKITHGNNEIEINKVNQFVNDSNDVALYNSLWGLTTLTPYKRREFLINSENIITQCFEHGDNYISNSGWILSLPLSYTTFPINVGNKVILDINFEQEQEQLYSKHPIINSVTGIPMLINEGKIIAELENFGSKSFSMNPHARTAIGFRADGVIIILVAEHLYAQPLRELTIGQMQDMLKSAGYSGAKLDNTNVAQALAVVNDQLQINSTAIGLTLPELANILLVLGCIKALNLDGGGSSTMFFDGQVETRMKEWGKKCSEPFLMLL